MGTIIVGRKHIDGRYKARLFVPERVGLDALLTLVRPVLLLAAMRSLSLLACISAFLLASSDVVDAKVSRVRHPKMKRPHHQARAIGAYNDLARELASRSSGSASSSGWDSKAPKTTAPKSNVWKALSNDEAAGVIELLHAQDWLNLTSAEDAGTYA